MPLEQLLILAIVQGLTEFWPISSSAHLILVPNLVSGWQDQGPLIDVAMHVGSLFAVIIYFHKEMRALMRGALALISGRMSTEARVLWYLVAASVPLLIVGFALLKSGYYDGLRSLEVIAWANLVFALLLLAIDERFPADRHIGNLRLRGAMLIGLAQVLALIPGASRAGVTMTAGRYLGMERPEAARFSMMLAIPSILGLGAGSAVEMYRSGGSASLELGALAAGLSFVAAFIAIWFMMWLLQRMSMLPFVVYRLALGAFLFVIVYG
jgi:undecaprenyl-diphosphatase